MDGVEYKQVQGSKKAVSEVEDQIELSHQVQELPSILHIFD
jgi:hypothetical protein